MAQKEFYSYINYNLKNRYKIDKKHHKFIDYLFWKSRGTEFEKIYRSESIIIKELEVTKYYITRRKEDIKNGKYPFISYKNEIRNGVEMGVYLIDYIILEKELKNIFKPEFVDEVKKEFRYSVSLKKPNYYKTSKVKLIEDCEKNLLNEYENNSLLLNNNTSLITSIAGNRNVETKDIIDFIQPFIEHIESIKKEYKNNSALYTHFKNWVNKQPTIDIDKLDLQLNSFIELFNNYGRRDLNNKSIKQMSFIATERIKTLFIKQLNNRFNYNQMSKAIQNLYSSSEKNKYVRDTGFLIATPEYLLNNLNKYLNAKF